MASENTIRAMRLKALLLIVLASLPLFAAEFDFGRTMRVDYFHTSTPKGDEIVALHGVVSHSP